MNELVDPQQALPMTTQWQTIIADLKAAGLSQSDIERRTFMSTAALDKLAEGVEPKHFNGERLKKVWREVKEGAAPVPAPRPRKGKEGA